MTQTAYVLKTPHSGKAVLAADTLKRAMEMQEERLARGVRLRLYEVTTTEREITR